jgi:hypothetical protein
LLDVKPTAATPEQVIDRLPMPSGTISNAINSHLLLFSYYYKVVRVLNVSMLDRCCVLAAGSDPFVTSQACSKVNVMSCWHCCLWLQVFSRMGWFHNKQRNQLSPAANEMETTIKMHWERFAQPKISSSQQAKRDTFDAAVASTVAETDMSAPAQLPDSLLAHVATNRAAAEEAAAAEADGSAGVEEAVTGGELADELSRLYEMLKPPEGHNSWTEAVMDAFEGWDFGRDLFSESYREVIQAPVVKVRPPTTGQFSVQNLLRQRHPLQPQQLLQQQLLQQHQLLQQGSVMGAQVQQLGMGLPVQQLLQQQAVLQQQQQHALQQQAVQQQQALQQQFAQGYASQQHH